MGWRAGAVAASLYLHRGPRTCISKTLAGDMVWPNDTKCDRLGMIPIARRHHGCELLMLLLRTPPAALQPLNQSQKTCLVWALALGILICDLLSAAELSVPQSEKEQDWEGPSPTCQTMFSSGSWPWRKKSNSSSRHQRRKALQVTTLQYKNLCLDSLNTHTHTPYLGGNYEKTFRIVMVFTESDQQGEEK